LVPMRLKFHAVARAGAGAYRLRQKIQSGANCLGEEQR